MEYSVGKYVIVPPKPFPTMEKAVQYIQERYPELDKVTIEKYLTPSVDGNNKSGNISEENPDSTEISTKNSATGTKGLKAGKDQSG